MLADPISIAIALRAAQRPNIQEGQLDYGFKEKPINEPHKKINRINIPEENLFNLNARVIEFKKPKYSEESEFDIDESEEKHTDRSYGESKQISNPKCFYYSDIGYLESNGDDKKFVNVPVSTTPSPIIRTIDPNCMGRIIDIPDDNSYLDHIQSEYMRACQCQPPRDIFTR